LCELYGSLAATGKGHGSHDAVLLGLAGHEPDTVDVDAVPALLDAIRSAQRLTLADGHEIAFNEASDLIFLRRKTLPFHPNGLRFFAFDAQGTLLTERSYFSVGGGFVVSEDIAADGRLHKRVAPDTTVLAHPFHSAAELLSLTQALNCSIAGLMRRNEHHWRDDPQIDSGLLEIWRVMQACVQRGLLTEGVLPGGFKVRRRAARLYRDLQSEPHTALSDPLQVLDWVNLYALAVNEENAAGGRVVTAPTNGAAGIIPAVLHYYRRFVLGSTDAGVIDFLLTAGAIGLLYKENASISGAEVGCQGEVGVACSMAAGALAAVLGGTPAQVENAAEIGMEHHLGLTCDPVGGLVQIPCIERNAIAAVKAINAARMALRGDGTHHVSLDKVIATMRQTGADMQTKYKETARGGLAVHIVEC
jgi:L-serine dehydratase